VAFKRIGGCEIGSLIARHDQERGNSEWFVVLTRHTLPFPCDNFTLKVYDIKKDRVRDLYIMMKSGWKYEFIG